MQKTPPYASPRSTGRFRPIHVASDTVTRFMSDRCPMLGASIAFYSAFSLAPTLLLVLAVIGWIFGRDIAQGRFFAQVQFLLGKEAAQAMQDIVVHAHYAGGSGIAAAFSIALLLVGASATFGSLNTALDIVFAAQSRKGIAGIALVLRARLVSIGLLIGLSFLLVVSLVLDAAITTLGGMIFGNSTLGTIAQVVQSLFGFVILALGLGALIKWLPDTSVPLRPALVGGAVASLLFTVGRHLFSLYLAHAGTAGVFGAAGSLAVLMMWLYFCAVVFLLGSEVTAALCRASGNAGRVGGAD
ncbi:ribonuclease [Burkholderia sp. SRS-W-2-2016]|uniref:YihY/virulence factor BrkB family protein n=1 Tax=Burkholderia sp. SRS-W-2-2016 TaxID=1926878 RepID=UPI00094B5701|nr:YihY/virulence factor BrkB family protein [Burkholderia sp. SRS-W-2-2016]OLL32066.1 ribonuclease [Burkholderia sp. SRS-W-2-2016]